MPDREKVIRDLRYLKSFGRVSNNPQVTEIAQSAIELLKEHEAVEPIRTNTNYEQHWKCGNCKAVISAQDKFCHECGQAVKWE